MHYTSIKFLELERKGRKKEDGEGGGRKEVSREGAERIFKPGSLSGGPGTSPFYLIASSVL